MSPNLSSLARSLAIPYYEDALPGHDQYHAARVRDLSIRLADTLDESVDLELLAAGAWLHDIGRPRERTGSIDDHDRWGAKKARVLLTDAGVNSERVERICACIRSHSIRDSSPTPDTPEARLLFDADKLDAIGAIGIVRLACIVGERSGRAGSAYASLDVGSAHELTPPDRPDVALLKGWAKERLAALHTPGARRLGESRWAFVETFFERFDAELDTA
ncbi:HD domain-containing protein [Halocatena halophila]|uniref:HD domain-containing protein n=1 Tax=Halocatena halophila TaxID=2814576 RepID=UPI002ED4479C